ncbi:reverse transcriptase-like protein, partial [Enterobacter hormaechei]|uniref:reverse transcriptase-like protein n=1 Tax=Enterobacter hormaechei TaxID=158836 RepID=UPI0023E420F2
MAGILSNSSLEKLIFLGSITTLHIYGDYQLVINQVNYYYQTKDEKLLPYKELVDQLTQRFTKLQFTQVPRMQNKAADAMATIGSLLEIPQLATQYEFLVEQLLTPAYV